MSLSVTAVSLISPTLVVFIVCNGSWLWHRMITSPFSTPLTKLGWCRHWAQHQTWLNCWKIQRSWWQFSGLHPGLNWLQGFNCHGAFCSLFVSSSLSVSVPNHLSQHLGIIASIQQYTYLSIYPWNHQFVILLKVTFCRSANLKYLNLLFGRVLAKMVLFVNYVTQTNMGTIDERKKRGKKGLKKKHKRNGTTYATENEDKIALFTQMCITNIHPSISSDIKAQLSHD